MKIGTTVPDKSGGSSISDPSIKNRLIAAATDLFAQQGFAGTSVREICTKADASVPMINHYFGSKQGLLDAILGQLSGNTFDVPVRLIQGELKSREEFLTKLDLFISEAFNCLLGLAPIFRIIIREGAPFADLGAVHVALATFLETAKSKGFLEGEFQPELVTGLVLDRLGNQVLFAVNPAYNGPNVLTDLEYRDQWLKSNTQALMFGLAGRR